MSQYYCSTAIIQRTIQCCSHAQDYGKCSAQNQKDTHKTSMCKQQGSHEKCTSPRSFCTTIRRKPGYFSKNVLKSIGMCCLNNQVTCASKSKQRVVQKAVNRTHSLVSRSTYLSPWKTHPLNFSLNSLLDRCSNFMRMLVPVCAWCCIHRMSSISSVAGVLAALKAQRHPERMKWSIRFPRKRERIPNGIETKRDEVREMLCLWHLLPKSSKTFIRIQSWEMFD